MRWSRAFTCGRTPEAPPAQKTRSERDPSKRAMLCRTKGTPFPGTGYHLLWRIKARERRQLSLLPRSACTRRRHDDSERVDGSVRLAFLKVAFDAGHFIGHVGETDHGQLASFGKGIEGGCFHLDRQ